MITSMHHLSFILITANIIAVITVVTCCNFFFIWRVLYLFILFFTSPLSTCHASEILKISYYFDTYACDLNPLSLLPIPPVETLTCHSEYSRQSLSAYYDSVPFHDPMHDCAQSITSPYVTIIQHYFRIWCRDIATTTLCRFGKREKSTVLVSFNNHIK